MRWTLIDIWWIKLVSSQREDNTHLHILTHMKYSKAAKYFGNKESKWYVHCGLGEGICSLSKECKVSCLWHENWSQSWEVFTAHLKIWEALYNPVEFGTRCNVGSNIPSLTVHKIPHAFRVNQVMHQWHTKSSLKQDRHLTRGHPQVEETGKAGT